MLFSSWAAQSLLAFTVAGTTSAPENMDVLFLTTSLIVLIVILIQLLVAAVTVRVLDIRSIAASVKD